MMIKYLIILLLLIMAELVYFRIADYCNIVDKPNERSSHKQIVLRGGGVIFLFSAWLYAAFYGLSLWPFLIGITLVSGIGFVDDIHSLPDKVRLLVQLLAVVPIFYYWDILNWDYWWIVVLGLIVCVGIINAYNFMDGINGIDGGYTLAVLGVLAYLNAELNFADQQLIVVAIMADLVFCFFNFRPKGKAKCFAGDVGSMGSAFIVIFLLGSLILKTGDVSYIVFLVVYGVDVVMTIIHRIILHENLGQAHRKHAYQLMANELGIEHTIVSSFYSVLQLLISIGMIIIPRTAGWHWGYFAVVSMALVVSYLLFMKKNYHLHEAYLASLKKD